MSLLKVWNGTEWVPLLGPSGIIGPQGPQGLVGSGIETIVNLGAGEGVFAQISGSQAEFKSLIGGSGIDLSSTSTEITLDFDITEVTEFNDLLAGIFYRKDENLIPDTDEVYTVGNTATQFNGIYAASGLFLGIGNMTGRVVVAEPNGGLECSIIERGLPGMFPALVLRGGRAVIMETSNLGTYASGYYMGPNQQILMGDIESYSHKTSLLYNSELHNFNKKITSILDNPTVGLATDSVGHYVFHRYTTNSTPGAAQIALEAQVQARTTAVISNSCTAIKATATSQQSASHTLTAGTYTGLDARVVHSGTGQLKTAKAAFFGVDDGIGRIDHSIGVHIGVPSGGQTRNLSLWCEGAAEFGKSVDIGDSLDVIGLATINSLSVSIDATIVGDLTVITNTDLQGIVDVGGDLEVTGLTTLLDDAVASGCLTTNLRTDTSRTELLGFIDTISFDRNILYLDGSAGAGVWSISNPGKNGQTTRVVVSNNGAGSFSLTFSYTGGIRWRGGVAPLFSPTPNGYDIFSFLYDATDDILYGDFSQGFV
ncbi:hypothetical protein KAR91_50205 [Candidatus Pacearchaeota archaeon]|nr:hypothetical protein [Candidatus Pacearchaeota archaeon]